MKIYKKVNKMKDLKIRCSQLSDIANVKFGLTEKQNAELETLKAKEKLTALQSKKIEDLELKKTTAPELSATGKTLVESIVKQDVYKYNDFFSSKYTDKGLIMEDEAIRLLNLNEDTQYSKNEKFFENDFITGTPDIITDKILDIKCSWSKKTFPVLPEEAHNVGYEWQMRGYLWLTGLEVAEVVYCLVNTPLDLRQYEPADLHEMEDLPLDLRFTKITYERDKALEEQIKEMVIKAREYAKEYKNKIIFK